MWCKLLLCWVFVAGPLGNLAVGSDIPGWRRDGTGRYPAANPPSTWSKDSNIVWQTPLPARSYASPILVQGRLYVPAEPSRLLCLDSETGKVLWEQSAGYAEALGEEKAAEIEEKHKIIAQQRRELNNQIKELRKSNPDDPRILPVREKLKVVDNRRREFEQQYPQEKHGGAGNAAATPVWFDGRVYVVFSTGIVAAFDQEGKRVWIKRLAPATLGFGGSASPTIADGKLIVPLQDLLALDAKTGEVVWRAKIPAKHGTPVVAQVAGNDVIATPSGALVRAADGKVLAEKLFGLSHNSPLVQEGTIYAHGSGKIKALKLPASLDAPAEMETLWETSGTRDQRMTSAVLHEGLLYAATRKGLMEVVDAKTGDIVYRKRLDAGEFFSSACLAGNRVFLNGRNGKMLVLKPGRQYEELAVNELDRGSSTPIFSGERIYFRSDKFLYCIGE